MAKLIRLLSVSLVAGMLLVPFNAPAASAQEACTQTVIYYPPFHSPDVQTGPVSCDICPPGVANWVNLYRGIVIVYTCHFR